MKFSETTLSSWTSPLSTTEESRVENTVRMIKDAVSSYINLQGHTIEVFAQGSYANNTNVRQNSDVDICVLLTSTFYGNYIDGLTAKDYGYSDGTISYDTFKQHVVAALKKKFGEHVVTVGNKCINISSNSYHVNADVVPAMQYRDYKTIDSKNSSRFIEGIKYFATDDSEIINYPKDHIRNGKNKNNNTNYEYKKLVRIMKHIRNNMVDDGLVNGDIISSFLVECLIWNVPNHIITSSNTWTETVKNTIFYLWDAFSRDEYKEWGEVSERFYLIHPRRKWTVDSVKDFMARMYTYLEFQ